MFIRNEIQIFVLGLVLVSRLEKGANNLIKFNRIFITRFFVSNLDVEKCVSAVFGS